MIGFSVVADNLGKAMALISAMSLSGGIFYDWGFYSALGLSFQDVPISIVDYLRTALVYFPVVISIAFLVLLKFVLLLKFVPDGEDLFVADSRQLTSMDVLAQRIILILLFFAGLILYLIFLLAGGKAVMLPFIAAMLIWGGLCFWPRSIKVKSTRFSFSLWVIIFSVPMLCFSMIFLGHLNAVVTLEPKSPDSVLLYNDESKESVYLLRFYDQGLLAADKTKKIFFVKWDEVKRIDTNSKYESKAGWFCRHFQVGCDLI